MEEEDDSKVILISSDSKTFELSAKAAKLSKLIKESIQSNTEDTVEFHVNNVKGEVLKKVVEYLEHYKDEEPKKIERPLPSANFKECVCEWDFNYSDISLDIIFEIILAANYLDIPPLLELASAKVTSILKGKTSEEIREIFGINNNFTPEEEQQIIEEKKWCMENL